MEEVSEGCYFLLQYLSRSPDLGPFFGLLPEARVATAATTMTASAAMSPIVWNGWTRLVALERLRAVRGD